MGTRKLAVALVPLLALSLGCGGAPEGEPSGADTATQEGAEDTARQAMEGAPPDSCEQVAAMGFTATAAPIQISLEDGMIGVEPDTAYVKRAGGTLRWASEDGDFVVAFKARNGNAPLGQKLLPGKAGGPPVGRTVQGRPPCWTYEYGLVVRDAAGDSLAVLDPPYQIIP